MLIQCARPLVEGSFVEVLRGGQLIVARAIWSEAGWSDTGTCNDAAFNRQDE